MEDEFWDDDPYDPSSAQSIDYSKLPQYKFDENNDRPKSERRMHEYGSEEKIYDRKYNHDRSSQIRGRRSDNFSRNRPIEESTNIDVDSSNVGKIIGRGGAKIQELQRESGARIKVMQNNDNGNTTLVRITGSTDARSKAKLMIENLTASFNKLATAGYNNNNSDFSIPYVSTNNSSEEAPIDWDLLNLKSEEARRKRLAALPPIKKDFYLESPEIAALSSIQVAKIRAENNSTSVVAVESEDNRPIPNPVQTFEQAFKEYPELLLELKKQGFTSPSPIQCQAWPIIMKGYDMIGIAQTGTGKTIAFLFPALIHIVGQVTPREERIGPSCLVLAPTRELAQQIEMEAKKYTYHNIKSVCVYGGGNRREQIEVVTKGVDIVIATPGRLNDLVMNKVVNVTGVTYLVLDEADRMLDMGFEPQIRKILLDVRPDRQTIMTSATWTNEIQELAARYMTKPLKVNIGAFNLAAVHSVTQHVIFAEDENRRDLLMDFIEQMGPEDKAIVFVERKSIADHISSDLILQNIIVQSIHGDREQCDREQALDDLKTGYVRILIATDVASRGLDIKDITHIFNMYFPRNIEEYVHRVGRTGRAGRTGTAISIFTREDWMHAQDLINILEEANQYVPQELFDMARRYRAWKCKKDAEDAACGGRRNRGRRSGRF
ncbi:probable ATP-dependent RNA helicase DDX43 [Uloborus diversus]|uniref:probable ATP-dependent RNA helicase DDX43 n=1 Tax=Uloborus diversus TaxID=327109 RepID=UPI0024091791|nr:probable ATP-dependent RNA helicase DDX43 [Uloborus diversus]